MNLTVKMLVFSALGLICVFVTSFPQEFIWNWMMDVGGYFLGSASLCIMAVSVNSVLKKQGVKSRGVLISKVVFAVFLVIYFLAYALNPVMVPFDPEQINFEIIGAVSFLICLGIVWNNYRISRGVEHHTEVPQGT